MSLILDVPTFDVPFLAVPFFGGTSFGGTYFRRINKLQSRKLLFSFAIFLVVFWRLGDIFVGNGGPRWRHNPSWARYASALQISFSNRSHQPRLLLLRSFSLHLLLLVPNTSIRLSLFFFSGRVSAPVDIHVRGASGLDGVSKVSISSYLSGRKEDVRPLTSVTRERRA